MPQRRFAPHLLASGSVPHIWRMLRRHSGDIDSRYALRALGIPVVSMMHAPFAAAEHLLTRRRVERQELGDPLVMIIGHWRSGTTNVHNFMLQDPRFGCVSLLHCLAPHEFLLLGRLARRLLRHLILSQRPMDRVPTGLDAPMSEDFGLVGVTDQTHYLGYFFPRLLEQNFQSAVLFEGVADSEVDRWASAYRWFLKKVSVACGGRPLALKNPANTGRIPALVERFPRMRFIFIRRNPFVVHASTCRLMDRFLDRWSLQNYDRRDMEEGVLRRQATLLERYFKDRNLVPQGQLVEIAHEDMVARPVETLSMIYDALDLGNFECVRSSVEAYAKSLTDYHTNEYEYDAADIERVRAALSTVIETWRYEPPSPTTAIT